MTDTAARPLAGTAEVHVLFSGYVDTDRSPWSVASTVTYLRDGDVHVIVDPGFVPRADAILDPLRMTRVGVPNASPDRRPPAR